MIRLGRLERVPLRDIWKSESSDFTPWLAQTEHIRLLGEALGLELEVEAQEKKVGPFRADILCKDVGSDGWVLVENQLERTDHGHLGQLLTYAAGLEAVTIVWIAERFTDEHRAALDWLNEIANERLRCFGLEIELWQIGDSPVAPKFNVVSQPNDWSRSVAVDREHLDVGDMSPTKQRQLEFWQAFADHLRSQGSKLPLKPPRARHYTQIRLGRAGAWLSAVTSSESYSDTAGPGGEIRAMLSLGNRAWFDLLKSDRAAIEAAVGEPLLWYEPAGVNVSRIVVARSTDLDDRRRWPADCRWLAERLERMYSVFGPLVRALPRSSTATTDDED